MKIYSMPRVCRQALRTFGWPALLVSLIILGPTVVCGASASASAKARAESTKKAFADSAALFIAGNAENAEKALTNVNRDAKESAAWHLESSGRLYRMALYLRAAERRLVAREVAGTALKHAKLAISKSRGARDALLQAKAWELEGSIHDALFDDPKAALLAYQEAVVLNPRASRANAEAARLTRVVQVKGRKR